jgi:uncharacterized protein (UPF0261 family)
MRTTPDECRVLGRQPAEKVKAYSAPVTVLLPLRGVSVISEAGGPFHDPEADAALFDAIRHGLDPGVRLLEPDCTINSPEFAQACATELLRCIKTEGTRACQAVEKHPGQIEAMYERWPG